MGKVQQWVAFTVVAVLAVLAAGWFLLISPKRASAAAVVTQAAGVTTATAQLTTQLAVLQAQAKDLPKELVKVDAVTTKIPAAVGLPDLLRTLSATATADGVELLSITPGLPTPVVAAVVATPVPTASTSSAATETASAAPKVAVAAADGSGTLNTVSIAMSVVGSYPAIEQFLSSLENLPRATRIMGLTLAPGTNPMVPAPTAGSAAPAVLVDGSSMTATITGQVFVAVGRTPIPRVVLPVVPTVPRVAPTPTPSAK